MAEIKPKIFFENCVSTIITGSKFFLDDLPPRIRPFAKVPVFLFFFFLFLAVAPIAILSKLVRKPAVNPFFKLRTELETKWYYGKQDEALSGL